MKTEYIQCCLLIFLQRNRQQRVYTSVLVPRIKKLLESVLHTNDLKHSALIIQRCGISLEHKTTKKRGIINLKNDYKQKTRDIIAVSDTVRGLVRTYFDAPIKSMERRRILSSFANDFTLKQINRLCFQCQEGSYIISKHIHLYAKEHAYQYGPGGRAPPKKEIRNSLDDINEEVNFATTLILSYTDPI